MRRAPIVLTSTVAGLAAVLSFKPREPALPQARTPRPSASASPSPAATTTSTPASRHPPRRTRTATGSAVSSQYGITQVRVTVSGSRIAKVEALQLPDSDPRSVMISNYAEPLLRQSTLSRQSGAIDAVSGATYTSESYQQSLQSALDELGFRPAH